nr:ATP-binding cassette domain-containing protein [Angustibacter aerolatus]
MAGLMSHRGSLRWNREPVDDPQTFLRPGRVAHVAQVPRVLSGTFADNIALDHDRDVQRSIDDARLGRDVADAGGAHALVGHRGVRLSGGQVQRLALARALAADAEPAGGRRRVVRARRHHRGRAVESLRARGSTVVGATTKRAALARADRVVVLVEGRVADTGPWRELEPRWGHLAG